MRKKFKRADGPAVSSNSELPPEMASAQWFAYLAPLPLLAAAIVVSGDGKNAALAANFMVQYGAALIIFLGGVRWGLGVTNSNAAGGDGVLPGILAMVMALPLFLPFPTLYRIVAIMVIIAVFLMGELRSARREGGVPGWFIAVKLPLTMLTETAFLIAVMGVRHEL